MEKKARQSLREKVVLHLLEADTGVTQAAVVAWGVHNGLPPEEEFVEELEGMVQDGLIRWDGTSYSLHSEGRKLAMRAKKKKGAVAAPSTELTASGEAAAEAAAEAAVSGEGAVGSEAAEVPASDAAAEVAASEAAASAAPASEAPASDAAVKVAAVEAAAPAAEVAAPQEHGHSHDHGGGHGHSHDHGAREERPASPPPRPKPPPAARPAPPPPKAGLRQLIKTAIKKVLGME